MYLLYSWNKFQKDSRYLDDTVMKYTILVEFNNFVKHFTRGELITFSISDTEYDLN